MVYIIISQEHLKISSRGIRRIYWIDYYMNIYIYIYIGDLSLSNISVITGDNIFAYKAFAYYLRKMLLLITLVFEVRKL